MGSADADGRKIRGHLVGIRIGFADSAGNGAQAAFDERHEAVIALAAVILEPIGVDPQRRLRP